MLVSLLSVCCLLHGTVLFAQVPPAEMFPTMPGNKSTTTPEFIQKIPLDKRPTDGNRIQTVDDRRESPTAQSGKGKRTDSSSSNNDLYKQYGLRLDPPGAETVFGRLEGEPNLLQRMRQENKDRKVSDKVIFPELPTLSSVAFQSRQLPRQAMIAEPRFVIYQRLFYEERNAERFGWDFGFIQPFVSTAYFLKDTLFLPLHLGAYPFRRYDSNAGFCLPGDPVPYMIPPPDITLSGSLLEAGTAVAIAMILP